MSNIRAFLLLLTISASILFTGCPEKGCEDGAPAMILDYTGLSGCNWVIRLENGEQLEPVNLQDFDLVPADSMIVHITYIEAPTMMSICMVGKMVEVICITEISNDHKARFTNAAPENISVSQEESPGKVMAYPGVISYRLPDDYLLDIYLKGDEFSHTVTTKDGYPLIMNPDGFYEYAIIKNGRPEASGIIARNWEDRDDEVNKFLEKLNH